MYLLKIRFRKIKQDSQEDLANLRKIKDNVLTHYYASCWFDSSHTTLNMFRETLHLNVMSEDKMTLTLGSHTINDVIP